MTLKKEIIVVLVIKFVLLFVIWSLWFDASMTGDQVVSGIERIILNR